MIKAPQAMRETEQGSEMWRVRKVGGYKHNLDAVMERGGVFGAETRRKDWTSGAPTRTKGNMADTTSAFSSLSHTQRVTLRLTHQASSSTHFQHKAGLEPPQVAV